ncbi:hypothetical protein Tco_1078921 [Tanacetum coccineum]|uniref:Uncharacterized protein n=1 Tax=Tanacetum coccineum TaxID=301880 RepID=A0ABQ5HQD1_9ASTR
MSEEVLKAREDLMKAIYTFLRKFSRIPFGVTPKVLLIAWERFSEIKHAFTDEHYQQEDIQELMSKLLEDVLGEEKSSTLFSETGKVCVEVTLSHSSEFKDNTITSPKIDFLPEEFVGELDFIDLILPGIDEDDFDEDDSDEEEGEIGLLYYSIRVVDFIVEEVDTFLVSKDSIPPGIESDLDSEGDIVFLDNLLNEDPSLNCSEDTIGYKELDKNQSTNRQIQNPREERVHKSQELSAMRQQKSALGESAPNPHIKELLVGNPATSDTFHDTLAIRGIPIGEDTLNILTHKEMEFKLLDDKLKI